MGIIYIEGCYSDCKQEPLWSKRRRGEQGTAGGCFPPTPPNLTAILARLASIEATLAANTARIAALEAQFGAPIDAIREEFQANLGNTVTVNATFDVIEGTVTTVGTDAVEITTPTGDVFIIPYTSVISVA
ncbi:hypothetical protein K7887_07020 [Sutcliffiella horikoshii]|mgnify:CR=1 FL=1|uniref:mechanosensitive ion channel domain-containing protein n=1 Tax=Sutcliffiella horikoshii TaxID=79883 RepID=UPI001CBC7124|nr:mechanosensitive ion channel domain-containing protein [Sutcliffiella horikoshii]UAL48677.1 hypothetical protein K7887_07020 [Sutcliffiella horikoshii]